MDTELRVFALNSPGREGADVWCVVSAGNELSRLSRYRDAVAAALCHADEALRVGSERVTIRVQCRQETPFVFEFAAGIEPGPLEFARQLR